MDNETGPCEKQTKAGSNSSHKTKTLSPLLTSSTSGHQVHSRKDTNSIWVCLEIRAPLKWSVSFWLHLNSIHTGSRIVCSCRPTCNWSSSGVHLIPHCTPSHVSATHISGCWSGRGSNPGSYCQCRTGRRPGAKNRN